MVKVGLSLNVDDQLYIVISFFRPMEVDSFDVDIKDGVAVS